MKRERNKLDRIDRALQRLIVRRLLITDRVAARKRQAGLPAFDPAREQQIRQSAERAAPAEYREDAGRAMSGIVRVSRERIAKKNADIVLIGMPGCGKSRLGALLSGRLSMPVYDTDGACARLAGMPVERIIAERGEDAFRLLEQQAVAAAPACAATVLVTGGGAILKKENRDALALCGRVYYLMRDLTLLDTAGRPLSQGEGALTRLYEQRQALYLELADVCVEAEDADAAAAQIEADYRAFIR